MGFIAIGDLHLDVRGFRPEIPGEDCVVALEEIARVALSRGLPLVLLGDVFDKNRPSPWVVGEAKRILETIPEVWFIQGNHDKNRERAWLTIVDTCRHLTLKPQEVGGHRLVGIDYAPMEEFGENLGRIDKRVDGIVCHQALKQGLGFDGAWNSDLDTFDSGKANNVWIGDLHAPMELFNANRTVRAVYSGSMWPRNILEAKHKPRILVVGDAADENGFYGYSEHFLPARHVLSLDIDSEETLEQVRADEEDLFSRLKVDDGNTDPRIANPVLHVKYFSDIPGVEDTFRGLLDRIGGGYYVETVLPSRKSFAAETRTAVSLGKEAVTFTSLLSDRLSEHGQVRDMALSLAAAKSSEDVRGIIGFWRNKILKKENEK